MRNWRVWGSWAWAVGWSLLLLALVASHAGCSTVTRLGPGDCAVVNQHDQVFVAGSGCEIHRVYK